MLDPLFPSLMLQFGLLMPMHECVQVTYKYNVTILLVSLDMLIHKSGAEPNNSYAMPLDYKTQKGALAVYKLMILAQTSRHMVG